MDTGIAKSNRRVLVGGLLGVVPVRHHRILHMISLLIVRGLVCLASVKGGVKVRRGGENANDSIGHLIACNL